jgi:Protein of unknown function (DUF1360)
MAQSTKHTNGDGGGGAALGSLTAGYAPGEERPLGSYVVLTAVYGGGFGASLLALHRRGHALPERLSAGDVVMAGVATHKLSRLLTKDKVTSFLRAPFTEFEEASGQGEVEERPRGHGLRLAVGELLVCPYCLAQWIAGGFALGLVGAPRLTRFVGAVFVAHTISDFMQAAYRAAVDRA